MLTPIKMNQRFTYGFATLLGLLPVLAIEGPDTLKPTPPPAVVEDEAAVNTPPEEAPRENEVAPPEDLSRAYLGIGTGELPALLDDRNRHRKLKRQRGDAENNHKPKRDQRRMKEPERNDEKKEEKVLVGLRVRENTKETLLAFSHALRSGHKSRQLDRAIWPER
jgi:hypothetical protein